MTFEILFENQYGNRQKFKWQILNRRYAEAWKTIMLSWKNSSTNISWNEKWFMAASEKNLTAKLALMKSLVERVDSLGLHFIGSSKIDINISYDELNRIHQEFHKFVEQNNDLASNPAAAETAELCHRLNDLVHHVEHAKNSAASKDLCRKLIATGTEHFQLSYDESDYEYFECTMRAGWIYLGYATPGKSLFHCFMNNDIEVVKNLLVRQSQGIANEIHLEFNGEKEIQPGYEEFVKTGYYDWCKKNNVIQYGYDYKKAIYNPGRIPLAFPVDDPAKLLQFFEDEAGKILDFNFL